MICEYLNKYPEETLSTYLNIRKELLSPVELVFEDDHFKDKLKDWKHLFNIMDTTRAKFLLFTMTLDDILLNISSDNTGEEKAIIKFRLYVKL